MNTIGRNISRIRKEQGLTMKELADLVGISQAFVSQVEKGTKTPSLLVGCKIAACLDTDIYKLMAEN